MPKKKPLTVEELSTMLYEEFEHRCWGDLYLQAFEDPPKEDSDDEMRGLYEVLAAGVEQLNNRE